MNQNELFQLLACGEDSRHQFKQDATNVDSLAAELAAQPLNQLLQNLKLSDGRELNLAGLMLFGRNLHHVQGDRGFNSLGQLEIPEEALEELLVNALIC